MYAQKFLTVVLLSALAATPRLWADSVVTDWNNATLQGIRVSKIGPPMVARALALVNTCMYDAWAAYDPIAVGTRGTSRCTVHHQVGFDNRAVRRKGVLQVIFGDAEGKVSHKQFCTHLVSVFVLDSSALATLFPRIGSQIAIGQGSPTSRRTVGG